MKCSNTLIKEVLGLTRQMIILADEGNVAASDDGCRLLYGVLGDCAYKIKTMALKEKENHLAKGKWDE
jgi:hypothetical protein